MRTELVNESRVCNSDPGETRFPAEPPTWKSPTIQRGHQRPNPASHSSRKEERRAYSRDARLHSTAVWTAKAPFSLILDACRNMGLEKEPLRRDVVEVRAMEPRQKCQLDADMPRGSASQKTSLLDGGQLRHSLQVKFDAGVERRFGFPEGIAIGGDVEVGADRMPALSMFLGIASQPEVHADSPLWRSKTVFYDGRYSTINELAALLPFNTRHLRCRVFSRRHCADDRRKRRVQHTCRRRVSSLGQPFQVNGRVGNRNPCPPSSNRAYGFPVHGFPMCFMSRHAPSSEEPSPEV